MKKYFSQIFVAAFAFAAVFTSCGEDEDKKPAKTISVGEQIGKLSEKVAGSVMYEVFAENIAEGYYIPLLENLPAGVTVDENEPFYIYSDGTAILRLTCSASIVEGTTTLRLTVDGATSAAFTLVIEAYKGGGTENDPFLVSTIDDLRNVGSADWTLQSHYKQIAHIDASGIEWRPIGRRTNISTTTFRGIYNGDGYSITNLTIEPTSIFSDDDAGMFGYIGLDGIVKNLALINVNITGRDKVGGVAGINYGTIQNCYVTGNIKGRDQLGGIAGDNSRPIRNCYTTCNVTCTVTGITGGYIGGIVGINMGALIENCYATGNVIGANYIDVGGIVGYSYSQNAVNNCIALNKEVRTSSTTSRAGRVSSYDSSNLSNNYGRESGMTLQTGNGSVTVAPSATGMHGADVSQTDYNGANSGTWWRTTAQFPDTDWEFAANKLPILKGFKQAQNPVVN